MSTDSLPINPDAAEGIAPVKDRLTTTLFLAALFHGIVILGITFALPRSNDAPAPTLEVLLLTNSDVKAADNASAQYLAQRNQQGSGTTDERVRPANPASSPLSMQQAGVAEGNSSESREAVAGSPSTELLSSRSDRSEVSFRSGEQQPKQAGSHIPLDPDELIASGRHLVRAEHPEL